MIHALIVIIGQQIHERFDNMKFGALDIVELFFIILMIIEQLFLLLIMRGKYINSWNIFDNVMIFCLIAIYIADVIVDNFYASAVFKVRALLRLFKITLYV